MRTNLRPIQVNKPFQDLFNKCTKDYRSFDLWWNITKIFHVNEKMSHKLDCAWPFALPYVTFILNCESSSCWHSFFKYKIFFPYLPVQNYKNVHLWSLVVYLTFFWPILKVTIATRLWYLLKIKLLLMKTAITVRLVTGARCTFSGLSYLWQSNFLTDSSTMQ